RLVGTRVDEPACLAYQPDTGIGAPRRARPAAPAGAKAGALGGLGDREEGDLLASRPLARARRPAVDPGRAHRVHERAIEPAVAREHDVPAAPAAEVGNNGGMAHPRQPSLPPVLPTSKPVPAGTSRSEEHTPDLQPRGLLAARLLLV